MAKLWVLVRLNFIALLSSLRMGSNKKGKVGGVGAMALFAGLSLYISGVYSFLFGSMLSESGLLQYLIPLIGLLGFFFSVMMTVFAASGFIFSNRDSDLMLSLPVSSFSVMLSKILALYLECFIFIGLFLLPSGIAHLVYGGGGGALFIVRLLVTSLFLPLLSTLFSTLIAYLVAWFTAHSTHKSAISTIITLVFVGGIMVLSFRINNLGAFIQQNQAAVDSLLAGALLPFGLLQSGVLGSWLALLEFCAICLIPFLAVVWLLSTRYKKILSGLASHSVRNDYKLETLRSGSQFSALLRKELARYFGSSIYLTNTAFGGLLLLGGCIYAVFARGKVLTLISQLGGLEAMLPMLLAAMALILSTINTTAVSISLEGKCFWILKEAPIPAKTLFKAKLAVNLLMFWSVAVISLLILFIAYGIPGLSVLLMLWVLLPLGATIALFGLIVNLAFPKMDADNDTVVVKQSASSLVGFFGGAVFVVLGGLLYMLLSKYLGFTVFCLGYGALLCLSCLLFWHYLTTKGAVKLNKL